jgi:hypothetical protein
MLVVIHEQYNPLPIGPPFRYSGREMMPEKCSWTREILLSHDEVTPLLLV